MSCQSIEGRAPAPDPPGRGLEGAAAGPHASRAAERTAAAAKERQWKL